MSTSDTAYHARVQLAVLDHNYHLNRNQRRHSATEAYQYHQRYRKQTKNWDVVKVLQAKEYGCIPDLMNKASQFWKESSFNMKMKGVTDDSHPTRIQSTIAHVPPPETQMIANNKKSRFQ